MKTNKTSSFILFFLIVAIATFLSGCGATRMATKLYAGNWQYHLETPQGDYDGSMVITYVDDVFKGMLESDQGTLELENFKIEDGKLSGSFEVAGYLMDIIGDFNGDVFTGTIGAQDFQMPFVANRKKQ